jgi:hypothetical protein
MISISSLAVECWALRGAGGTVSISSISGWGGKRLVDLDEGVGSGWVGASITKERADKLLSTSKDGDSYCHIGCGGTMGKLVTSPFFLDRGSERVYFGCTCTLLGG